VLASYQRLLQSRPFAMHLTQSAVIAVIGNITAQVLSTGEVTVQPIAEQVILTVGFIAPIVSCWFPLLSSLKLHWTLATAVDQFVFSPIFNIAIFWFISAVFKGGVGISGSEHMTTVCTRRVFWKQCSSSGDIARYDVSLSLYPAAFPTLADYSPVWSTQVSAYYLWLPATVVREVAVPDHLKGLFVNLIAFFWNIIFSIILAASD